MAKTGPHFAGIPVVQHLFGEPVRSGGVTVIPVARFSGGGGGKESEGGFGGLVRPVGAFVLDEGRVYWRPVTDLSGVFAALGIGYTVFALLRANRRRRRRRAGEAEQECSCEQGRCDGQRGRRSRKVRDRTDGQRAHRR